MDHTTSTYTLVLDAGTTSIKAFVFDDHEHVIAKASRQLEKNFPQPNWVEQDPRTMIVAAREVLREVVEQSGVPVAQFIGLGIATQRETIVAWDKKTSQPLYPAIVWQDTRTKDICEELSNAHNAFVQGKTGLPIDPYFSASKMAWIIEHVPLAKKMLAAHRLAMGTVDSWLIWNLAKGSPHLTDYTNASRTLLFDIRGLQWDTQLLAIFGISPRVLPQAQSSCSAFGVLHPDIIGKELPIMAVTGDQQASLYAAGTEIGITKITYGTGTFVMQVLGPEFALQQPFFTTLTASSIKQPIYAVEAKATSGIENAEAILNNSSLLQSHLRNLVQSADALVLQLPQKPTKVIIDGGWIRDGKILPIQSSVSSSPVYEQQIYDGTALGVCRIIRDNVDILEV